MQKALYLEAHSGIAGNMFAGTLIDLGVPLEYIHHELAKLPVDGYELDVQKVYRRGITATYFNVILQGKQPQHRHLPEILEILRTSDLAWNVKQYAASVFWQLASAEGRAHDIPPEQVHFHEVGAVDCIVDIVTVALGLSYLEVETVLCSALATGSGTVDAAHGTMSIPTPATRLLLEAVPTTIGTEGYELTTPTGAALATTFAVRFGDMPPGFVTDRVGYGAGTYELPVSNTLCGYLGYVMPHPQWRIEGPYVFGTESAYR